MDMAIDHCADPAVQELTMQPRAFTPVLDTVICRLVFGLAKIDDRSVSEHHVVPDARVIVQRWNLAQQGAAGAT